MDSTHIIPSSSSTIEYDMSYIELYHIGNIHHINEQYEVALTYYTNAEMKIPTLYDNDEHSKKNSLLLFLFHIYTHRSYTYYLLKNYNDAYKDSLEASYILINNKNNLSGLYTNETEIFWKRHGMICYSINKYNDAAQSYQRAYQLQQLNNNNNINSFNYMEWIDKCKLLLQQIEKEAITNDINGTNDNMNNIVPSTSPSPSPISPPLPTNVASHNNNIYVVPKYQYYQNDQYMIIQIIERQLNSDKLKVIWTEDTISITIYNPYLNTYVPIVIGKLYDTIIPDQSRVIYKTEKTLIKLYKNNNKHEWNELLSKENLSTIKANAMKKPIVVTDAVLVGTEHTDMNSMDINNNNNNNVLEATTIPNTTTKIPRPYSSHRDWDSIEKDIMLEEINEKAGGDDAMNSLFEQIYGDADPDTRRAMIKSYQTSGGTVLSTNWNEVGTTNYEEQRTAPNGMEWKTWEGQKLPMKKEEE